MIHGYWIWILSRSVSQLQLNIQLCSGILFQTPKVSEQMVSAALLARNCCSHRSAGGVQEAPRLARQQLLRGEGRKFTIVLVHPTVRFETFYLKCSGNW